MKLLCIAFLLFFAGKLSTGDPLIDKAMKAIYEGDYVTLEGLREKVKPEHIPILVKKWNKELGWPQKDGFITLLMYQRSDLLIPLMKDGLDSPVVDTRITALSVLRKDFKLFETFLDGNGAIMDKKVDEAIAEYKKQNP